VTLPVDPTVPCCPACDGDGYTETWNADQSGVVITPCECVVGREPTDDEVYNRPGVEGGIGYAAGASSW
jgi:hypothetical protein